MESNYSAPPPFLAEKVVVSILMAWKIEVDILFPVDQVLGRSCLISLGTIFFVSESKQHILATLWLFSKVLMFGARNGAYMALKQCLSLTLVLSDPS